jgi:hypothetical protein
MSSAPNPMWLNVLAQRNENDYQEEVNRGKALRAGGTSNSFPSPGSNSSPSSYNAKQDAREAMMLRREENDHNAQQDLSLGEQKRQGDLNRTLARDAAIEAAANRQKKTEQADAQQLKSDIGWSR